MRRAGSTRRRAADPSSSDGAKAELVDSFEPVPQPLLLAAAVGVLTGSSIVLLNTAVHWGRDLFEQLPGPLPIFAPAFAGALIGLLLFLRGQGGLVGGTDVPSLRASGGFPAKDPTMAPTRAVAAAVTLAGGNSLGPEGPSVEIGANIAAALGDAALGGGRYRKEDSGAVRLTLLAAGAASGIAAGFNAPIAGLFFALESVVSPAIGTTAATRSLGPSMQFLAAVLAATVSQLGLGSSPAVDLDKVNWEPRESLWELPLFFVLGASCGIVAAALRATGQLARQVFKELKAWGVPPYIFPIFAGLLVSIGVSLGLEEVVYKGFDNVNEILQEIDGGRLPPRGDADALTHIAQLLAAKVLLTAVCQTSGLVGGLFAPALFLGGSLGGLFGRGLRDYLWDWPLQLGDIHAFSVPVAYSLVGMAASLAAICGVPLTSVVLLLELGGGNSYGVVLPTVAAVGVAVYVEASVTAFGKTAAAPTGPTVTGIAAAVAAVERMMEAVPLRSEEGEISWAPSTDMVALSRDKGTDGDVRDDEPELDAEIAKVEVTVKVEATATEEAYETKATWQPANTGEMKGKTTATQEANGTKASEDVAGRYTAQNVAGLGREQDR